MTFEKIRKTALENWLTGTSRTLTEAGFDEFEGAWECKWQNRAEGVGKNHVSFFCSLGAFSGHITDLLTDERLDILIFNESEESDETLFRYYSRVLLIASEILDDFRKIGKSIFNTPTSNLSPNLDNLVAFTNNAIKHKIKLFHYCSHIQIWFYDNDDDPVLSLPSLTMDGMFVGINRHETPTYETFEDFKKEDKSSIASLMIPSLSLIIDTIVECYQSLDGLIEKDEDFLVLCGEYEE